MFFLDKSISLRFENWSLRRNAKIFIKWHYKLDIYACWWIRRLSVVFGHYFDCKPIASYVQTIFLNGFYNFTANLISSDQPDLWGNILLYFSPIDLTLYYSYSLFMSLKGNLTVSCLMVIITVDKKKILVM